MIYVFKGETYKSFGSKQFNTMCDVEIEEVVLFGVSIVGVWKQQKN